MNDDIYIGFCKDLKIRFKQHNAGRVSSTKSQRPWKLVYYEAYKDKKDATKREQQLKNNHKAKKDLKDQIKNSILS